MVVVVADLGTREGRLAVVSATAAFAREGLDLCVLNAGVSQGETVEELVRCGEAIDVTRRLMEVNYFGSVDVLMPLVPLLLASKSGARVCATNSLAGLAAAPTRSGYSATQRPTTGLLSIWNSVEF